MGLHNFPAVAAPRSAASPWALLPRAPQSIEETGLSNGFLVELLGKTMLQQGLTRLVELGSQLRLGGGVVDALCQFMRREGLLEVTRRGQHEADVQYELTQAGHARALEWLARNAYVGAAPVPLAAYAERVRAQSAPHRDLTLRQAHQACAGLVLPEGLLDQLGTALNSGRPLLLYGPAGSGKTYLAQSLQRLLGGAVAIPHAICVHDEVIRVFDAQCHRPLPAEAAPRAALDNRSRPDPRWQLCERPVIASGGELTLEMLDLSFDNRAGYYEAPPHFKANNGLFIVDDLGRQVVTPRALMNRWIVPMEHRHDHLMLRNGGKFTVPFEMTLVFSSNLEPRELEDAAFLRRLGHKIRIGALDPQSYARVFENACGDEGLPFDSGVLAQLVHELHPRHGRPLLACYPRDLLRLIASRARYLELPAALSSELLDWAWSTYFGNEALIEAASSTGSPPCDHVVC
ncbi:ATP-binding protein [Roseateles sp. DAIF2]|uniref:ATP-binding protein n=1 Tax=Roseateles sp. DAIF2 TaxID=2714952 RepID=UPI0018A33992|nr:ATP-binding protein [Roseateles sp. DAIF2]QPF73559.1 ATP-binding protein [Roseateles sp. DAIF2]